MFARTPRSADLRALESDLRVVITLKENGKVESSHGPLSPLPRYEAAWLQARRARRGSTASDEYNTTQHKRIFQMGHAPSPFLSTGR